MVSLFAARRSLPRRVGALLACALLAAASAHAQAPDSTALRLADLLAEAEAASPLLRAARLEAAARAQAGAQAGALPEPTASAMLWPYPIATGTGGQRGEWSVMQEFPWPGTLALRVREADHAAEAAAFEAEALALEIALEVREAYHALYQAQRAEAAVAAFAERLDAFAEAATARYEVGRGPQGAILQVRLERERLRERLLAIDARREAARQRLARLTGRPDLLPEGPLALEPPPEPDEQDGPRLRPEARALAAEGAQAEVAVDLARKAFYPDLGLGLIYMDMVGDGTMGAGERVASGLGVMISARIPIRRGRLRARLEEARLRRAQVEARQAALAAALASEVAEARAALRREAEALRLFRERLAPQAQATLESVLAAYTTGEVDYRALLEAERDRFEIQLGLEDARARYLNAAARLERALGGTPSESDR